jgi:moderate conductance mechanosensitive channel
VLNTTPSLFSGPVDWRSALFAIIPTIVVAWLAAIVAARAVRRLLKTTMGDELSTASPLVRAPLRLVSLLVFVIVSSLVLFPAFELVGSRPRTGVTLGEAATWAYDEGMKVLVIVLLAWALTRIVALLVRRFEYQVSQGTSLDALERGKRARTLGSLVNRVATIAIWGAAALMVLDQFHINIAPVLTTAGIAGLAVGFGAQTLVRDIIGGFFLILEDQVRVGDVVSINNVGGLVEQINLRTIVLRDEEGAVHVFPNGAITTLANRSKDFSYYVITLALPYSEDPDRVIAILKTVGDEMERDPQYGPFILEPIEVFGVDAFADWSVQVKLRIKTVPLKQWDVGRELRKRIRRALSQNGVQVPFPALAAAMPTPPISGPAPPSARTPEGRQ